MPGRAVAVITVQEGNVQVVAGVTGKTGAAAAESLIEQGQEITVIVRSEEKGAAWKSKGARAAVANLENSTSLRHVLSGAHGAYLLLPPKYSSRDPLGEQRRLADSLAEAVAESGIENLVFLSSIGAQHDAGTGPIRALHYAESVLTPAAKNLTILRACFFLENWAPALPPVKEHGVLPSFLTPDRKIPMIATKDIGRFAADALVNPFLGHRVIEIEGPQEYSPEEIAQTLASLLGREVRLQTMPPSAAVPALTSAGFSEELARLFEEMYTGINSGHVAFQKRGAEFRKGTVTAAQLLRNLLGA
jgi:uncharacterized protein YbjT (DUF2867 family)